MCDNFRVGAVVVGVNFQGGALPTSLDNFGTLKTEMHVCQQAIPISTIHETLNCGGIVYINKTRMASSSCTTNA